MDICERHPVRNSYSQKTDFLYSAAALFEAMGYICSLMQGKTSGITSRNLIAGDISTARVIVAAHYDTPRILPLPCAASVLSSAKNFLFSLIYILLPLALAVFLSRLTGGGTMIGGGLFVLLVIVFAGVAPARHSKNTADSGLLTLFEVMNALPPDARRHTAAVLLDNRHIFASGAALLAKKIFIGRRVVIDIEAVSAGERLFACSKNWELAARIAKKPAEAQGLVFRVMRTDCECFENGVLITRANARGNILYGRNENSLSRDRIAEAAEIIEEYIINN